MKSETNSAIAFEQCPRPQRSAPQQRSAAVSAAAPKVIPSRRSISIPLPPQPLSPKDRQYLRALQEAEMQSWLSADTAVRSPQEQAAVKPSLGKLFSALSAGDQKRELMLLLILAAAALVAIGSGLFQSASFPQRWEAFVRGIQAF
jgi:hypothetical protein